MTDPNRLLSPNRRTVLRSIGMAGLAATLQVGGVVGASDDETSTTYGFETGLDDWTVIEDSFSRTDDVAYEGSYAAGLDSYGSIDTVAFLDLPETIKPQQLNFAWRETAGSFGGGILVRNESGNLECFAGSNNPQWVVIGDNSPDGPGATQFGRTESYTLAYDNWIRTELEFDWDDESFDVSFTDTETGDTATERFPLNEGENIDQIELHGYAAAGYEAGSEPITDSCDMYWDGIEIIGSGDAGSDEGSIEPPVTEQFEGGLNGWAVDQRYRLSRGSNPGDGGYSDKYGGSVRLHVDGGPSTIGVGRETTGIPAGSTIATTVQVEASFPQPGNVSIAVFDPDGDDEPDERIKNDGDVTSGEIRLSGTVEESHPEDSELRVWADVWPGEFTAYVTEVSVTPSADRASPYTDEDGYVDSEGLLDAGADYRDSEIDEDRLSEVAEAFRSGEPLS